MHVHELAFPDACRDWDHAIRLKLQQTQRWSLAAGMTWNGTIKQSIGPYGYGTPTLIILSDLLLATRSHNLSIKWSVFWSNVAARLLFFVPSEQVSNHGRRTPGPSWMKHWNEELKQETIRDMMYWQKLFCCSKKCRTLMFTHLYHSHFLWSTAGSELGPNHCSRLD